MKTTSSHSHFRTKETLSIKGARVHNLKNISIDLPKNALIVFTGLSGSGKSSLAFDTVYAEGQRRYAESLSAYARQFMEIPDKPDIDEIKGLSPTIAIDQKTGAANPRSTVGTITEVYDMLRLLFSKIGTLSCPVCGDVIHKNTSGEIVENIKRILNRSGGVDIYAALNKKADFLDNAVIKLIEETGVDTIRIDGTEMSIHDLPSLSQVGGQHSVDVLVARIEKVSKINIAASIDKALEWGNGMLIVVDNSGDEHCFSEKNYCPRCEIELPALESRLFSFNNPFGACPKCTGLGITMEVDRELVVPNPRLTIAEGAVQPWMRITGNQAWYHELLHSVARTHGFSTDEPFEDLSKDTVDIIFNGTGDERYTVGGKRVVFEGVIQNLEKRYKETDSDYVRKEIEQYMREKICSLCGGKRLRKEALAVKLNGLSIADIASMSIEEVIKYFSKNDFVKTAGHAAAGYEAVHGAVAKEISQRLKDLARVGLDYLTLDRSATTLSGGELQRVRLSTQLSTGLTGVIYILDEPSVGLHPRDNQKLISSLKDLRDLGNTVIVVEHDAAMMEAADYIVDIGPGAGMYGGEIVAEGTLADIKKNAKSLTGKYLSKKEEIPAPEKIRKGNGKKITVHGAKAFNLKNITVDFPLGLLICITGVSGSGKSSLVVDILGRALNKHFYRAKAEPGEHKSITGLQHIDKVIAIDQSPIGRTPRSNPATYTGLFTQIRDLFASIPEARARMYDAGKFSFNVKGGGRCEACAGEGYVRIPMQFLADVFVECNECLGERYNRDILEVHYRGKNIAQVLKMTVEEAYQFFRGENSIVDKCQVLRDVGLGYVELGQPATTLSGGEAQRVKLATELSRRATGRTLYILDEPTTGLHFEDIKHLLGVLNQLVEKGNTVVIIEHNIDVIKCADWIIDMGPLGGDKGGFVVAQGTPKEIIKNKKSETAEYLREVL